MPRRSANEQAFPRIGAAPERLRAPLELSEIERTIFIDLVSACKANAFQASDLPLLVNYVQAVAAAREANDHLRVEGRVVNGRQSPWLAVLAQAQKTMLGFAHRLRLSPQGRSPTNPSRPSRPERPLSVYETMALEADDGSA
jgi:phage terminase small subunit